MIDPRLAEAACCFAIATFAWLVALGLGLALWFLEFIIEKLNRLWKFALEKLNGR